MTSPTHDKEWIEDEVHKIDNPYLVRYTNGVRGYSFPQSLLDQIRRVENLKAKKELLDFMKTDGMIILDAGLMSEKELEAIKQYVINYKFILNHKWNRAKTLGEQVKKE